ncbi:MAG: hypothetical protein ACI35W_07750 [Anaeroplasmataceae bacterium]
MAKRQITKEEYENAVRIRAKIHKIVNITITIISIVVALVAMLLAVMGIISFAIMGVIVPLALAIYLLMGVLVAHNDQRKGVMIFYIIMISICLIVFLFDLFYFNIMK